MDLYQRAVLLPSFLAIGRAAARDLPKSMCAGLTTRAVSLTPNKDPDNMRWVIATEQPALVYDWELDRVVTEVLLMDGVVYPENNQVPLLDCHARWTCDDQLGSVADFSSDVAGAFPAISGVVRFAADERSQRTRQKVLDRHLTDGSAGYRVLNSIWIPDGVDAMVRGRKFTGPIKISTDWALREYTLTPIGADSLSKYMGQTGQLAQARP